MITNYLHSHLSNLIGSPSKDTSHRSDCSQVGQIKDYAVKSCVRWRLELVEISGNLEEYVPHNLNFIT